MEVAATGHIHAAGFAVDVMMQEFQSSPEAEYWDACTHWDFVALEGSYFGGNVVRPVLTSPLLRLKLAFPLASI